MVGPAILVLLLSGCAFQPELEPLRIPTAPPQPFQDFAAPVASSSALEAQPAVPAPSYGDVEAPSRLSPGMQLASALGGGLGVMLVAGALLWMSLASGRQLKFQKLQCQAAKLIVGLIAGAVGLVLGVVAIALFLLGAAESSAGAETVVGIVHGLELMIVSGVFMIGAIALLYASYKAIGASDCLE